MLQEQRQNEAYRLTFTALELFAGAACIDMRRLHHRYQSMPAVSLLRRTAADNLRQARAIDRPTVRKVWCRHKPQITG